MIKKGFIVAVATYMASLLPAVAQSYYVEDDIYYSPDDKNPVIEQVRQEREATNTPTKTVAIVTKNEKSPSTTTQSKTPSGIENERDIDEYNRRYSSTDKDTTVVDDGTVTGTIFAYNSDQVAPGDTLYVQLEDGYYLNDFNGSLSDYQYTVQIHRFYDPKYTVSISDPAYSSIYMLDSNDWNVYIDGSYAWVTPTWSNPWYWSYTWAPFSYSSLSWRWNWGWGSPYYGWYDPWYYPGGYYGWHSPYYHGWYDPYYAWHSPHHHHPYPGHHPGYHPGTPGHHPGMDNGSQHRPSNRYGGTITAGGSNHNGRGNGGTAIKGENNSRGRRITIDSPNNRGKSSITEINRGNNGRRTNNTTTINNGRKDNNDRTTINNRSNRSNSNIGTSSSSNRSSSYTPSSSSSSRRSSGSSYNSSRNSSSRSSVSPSRSSSGGRSTGNSSRGGGGGRGSSSGRR